MTTGAARIVLRGIHAPPEEHARQGRRPIARGARGLEVHPETEPAGDALDVWVERSLVRFFPALAGRRVEHAWGGPIDVSPSHIPQLGTLPGAAVHFAFGYTGNGVGPTHLAARALDLPGLPSVALHVEGTAPIDDYEARRPDWMPTAG